MNQENYSGYVLAGGKSSRLGTDKAFLEIDGTNFLEHAVKTLEPVCENRVKIVLNPRQNQTQFTEKLSTNIPFISDIFENRGVLGGIHAALKDCETKYAIVMAVDLPFVTSEIIQKLTEFAEHSNKYIAVVPRQNDENIQPLCAVYQARYCLRMLERLMNENENASAHDFLELVSTRYVTQAKLGLDEAKDYFFNVNFQSDYQQVK